MDNIFTNKNRLFSIIIAIGIIILLSLIVASILLSKNSQRNTHQPTPTSSEVKNITGAPQIKNNFIESINPNIDQMLASGKPTIFTLQFKKATSLNQLTLELNAIDIAKDNGSIPVKIKMSQQSFVAIIIQSIEAIEPNRRYILTVKDSRSKEVLAKIDYRSAEIAPSPIPSNNPSLIQFLPHETDSYKLSYLASRNLYISNFKYNPKVSGTLSQQYEKARTYAIEFIKSKGIDPATLTIDFRRN